MAFDWNVFRILADVSHTLSKCILIWAIHSNKSAEGVSLITQIFYLVVFCARYLFLGWGGGNTFHRFWNTTLKLFYLISSAYIIFIMMRVYARTREREKAWKVGMISLTGSLTLAPLVMLIFKSKVDWGFGEFAWIFSLILESICVLPQLLLLRQTTVPTVIDSFYLVTLGSYRGFYLINWLIRAVREQHYDPISVIFGLVQTALYIDFAWVYWTRQRVKLRGGAVVDSDDLSKGWLVKRLLGNARPSEDDGDGDEEDAPARRGPGGGGGGGGGPGAADRVAKSARRWGPRGISVSADEGVHDVDGHLAAPDEFEDDEDGGHAEVSPDRKTAAAAAAAVGGGRSLGQGVGGGNEWHDENTRR